MADDLLFEVEGTPLTPKQQLKQIFSNPLQHLRTGISYMLPFILVGGIISALGSMTKFSDAAIWELFKTIGSVGLQFYVPIFGTFIAYSIADKPAIAPAFICSYLANTNGSGYLGALLSGFLVGWLVAILKTFVKPSKMLEMIWGYIVPALACLIVGSFVMVVLNGPISAFAAFMAEKLGNVDPSKGALVGAMFGALDGVDYGGPISKIASVIMYAGFSKGLTTFVGIRISYIMVPPLGFMLAAFLAPKLFTKSERDYARTTWPIVFIGGYTELALPLVLNDIIRCTIASFCGSVVAGAIAGYTGLAMSVPCFGIASWFFMSSIPAYLICLVAGTLVTAGVLIFLRKIWPRKNFDPNADEGDIAIM